MLGDPSVVYNAEQKIWKSVNYPHSQYISQTLGEAFLKAMRSIDEKRILEHHYDSGTSKSAGEIYCEAVTVARNLQRMGLRKGDVVLFYSMNNPKISALTFGCLLIGAVVSFFDTTFSKEHTDYALQLLQPAVILYEEVYSEDLMAALERIDLQTVRHLMSIETCVLAELFRPISADEIAQFHALDLGDPQKTVAALVLTSGSTGMPKANALSHSIMLHSVKVWWWDPEGRAKPDQDSVIFGFSSLRWIGTIMMMLQSVLLGLRRVYVSDIPAGAYGREIIRKYRVTHFFTAPGLYYDVLRAVADDDMDALSSLRIAQLGGDPTSQTVIEATNKLVPKCCVIRCYGMTELSGAITNDGRLNGGQIQPGMEMKILDESGAAVGPNVGGMLLLRSPAPYIGYIRCDNSKYYYPDGFFITGDYAFVDDECNLHLEARYKDLVQTKEVTFVPNSIETMVNQLPAVSSALLVGYRSSTHEDYDTAALFVTLEVNMNKNSQDLIRQQIFDTLNTQDRANIRDFYFVDKFPRLSCGKVDRAGLQNQAISYKLNSRSMSSRSL